MPDQCFKLLYQTCHGPSPSYPLLALLRSQTLNSQKTRDNYSILILSPLPEDSPRAVAVLSHFLPGLFQPMRRVAIVGCCVLTRVAVTLDSFSYRNGNNPACLTQLTSITSMRRLLLCREE
jgi:hypothetical protein